MPTLNEQVREIVGDYNELHLKEVKRQKPAIAPYLKLAIDDDLIPDDLEFESAGHAVYFLQIRELEKELVSRAVLKLQEIQGKLSNYLGQASFMGKDVISNLVDKLKTNPLDINFQTIESELKKLPSGESEFVRSVLTEISSTIKGDKVHQSITGVINDLKSQDGTEKDEAKEGEVEKSSGYKIPRDLKDSLGDSFSAINNIFDTFNS